MEQVATPPQLSDDKKLIVDAEHVIEPNDILVSPQFPQDVHLLLELRDVLRVVPKDNTLAGKLLAFARAATTIAATPSSTSLPRPTATAGVALGLAAGGNAYLAIGPLPNDKVSMEQVCWPSVGRRGGLLLRAGARRYRRGRVAMLLLRGRGRVLGGGRRHGIRLAATTILRVVIPAASAACLRGRWCLWVVLVMVAVRGGTRCPRS
mmetsp:Transcript_38344/g.114796  ORF Transcript_38344/g.114796 Transcript_38344/m.114796 type:complete len:207 (+) Transcript_38344:804-1424(+)